MEIDDGEMDLGQLYEGQLEDVLEAWQDATPTERHAWRLH